MIIKFEKFEVSSLSFEQVKVSPKDTVLLPRVDSGECPLFQLPCLVTWGVPKQSKFFATDKDRLFIQIVLEGEVLEKFRALDELLWGQQMQHDLFGSGGFEYQPIVKEGPKGEHIKVKLQTDHETGNITTFVVSEGVVYEDFKTLQGFEKHVPYKSTVRTIIKLVKIWSVNKKYGATFKLVRIGVQAKEPETETKVVDFID